MLSEQDATITVGTLEDGCLNEEACQRWGKWKCYQSLKHGQLLRVRFILKVIPAKALKYLFTKCKSIA